MTNTLDSVYEETGGSKLNRKEITENLNALLCKWGIDRQVLMCDEVSFWGRERVDFLGYSERSQNLYCFEIKSCAQDFNSKHRHTFFGNLNYYVLPYDLYYEISEKIPAHVGVFAQSVSGKYLEVKKKAKNIELQEENFDRLFRNLFVAACYRRMTAIVGRGL